MGRLAPGLYEYHNGPIRLTLADVEAKGGELRAWAEIHEDTKRLHYGDYNLRGPRTVTAMAQACQQRSQTRIDWPTWLGECCYQVIHDTLEGDPPVELSDQATGPSGWIVDRLVGDVGATSLIGFGQTGKSLLAVAAALTVCSGDPAWLGLDADPGAVLYLDWEADERTHRWRISQLCRGANRPCPRGLYYMRPRLPLARTVTPVARYAAETRAGLLVVDSVMLARGGDAFGPEATLALYAALDRIGLPCLLVDHRAKRSVDNGDAGPFGSVANFNSLRMAWGTQTANLADGFTLTLKKVKANYHGMLKSHSWAVRFDDSDRAVRFEPGEVGVTRAESTTSDRIAGLLARAGMAGWKVADLAREVGTSESSVRGLLARLKKQGRAANIGGVWLADNTQEEAPF